MRPTVSRAILLVAAAVLLVAVAALWLADSSRSSPAPGSVAAGTATALPVPAAAARPPASPSASVGAQASGQAKPTAAAQAKPTAATQAKPTAAAQVPGQTKPADTSDPERARIVRDATWTPGQLQDHFEKHGDEGPWASESVYDASARETVSIGTRFTYVDRATNAERLGFFDKGGNRFTSVTNDGRRITTHFRPDRGEAYVRGLYRSTYR